MLWGRYVGHGASVSGTLAGTNIADAVIKAAGGFDASIVEAMLRHRVQHGRPDWDVYVAKVDGVICGAALVVPPGRAYAPECGLAHPPRCTADLSPSDILDRIDGEIQEWHDKIVSGPIVFTGRREAHEASFHGHVLFPTYIPPIAAPLLTLFAACHCLN